MSDRSKGWLCPACGGGVAPHVERCPCVEVAPDKALEDALRRAREAAPQPVIVPQPYPVPMYDPPWYEPPPPPRRPYEIWCEGQSGVCPPIDHTVYGPGPSIDNSTVYGAGVQ